MGTSQSDAIPADTALRVSLVHEGEAAGAAVTQKASSLELQKDLGLAQPEESAVLSLLCLSISALSSCLLAGGKLWMSLGKPWPSPRTTLFHPDPSHELGMSGFSCQAAPHTRAS